MKCGKRNSGSAFHTINSVSCSPRWMKCLSSGASPRSALSRGEASVADVFCGVDSREEKMVAHLFMTPRLETAGPSRSSGETPVAYRPPSASRVLLRICGSSGSEIRELVNGVQKAKEHDVRWDGKTCLGDVHPPGSPSVEFSAETRPSQGEVSSPVRIGQCWHSGISIV